MSSRLAKANQPAARGLDDMDPGGLLSVHAGDHDDLLSLQRGAAACQRQLCQ